MHAGYDPGTLLVESRFRKLVVPEVVATSRIDRLRVGCPSKLWLEHRKINGVVSMDSSGDAPDYARSYRAPTPKSCLSLILKPALFAFTSIPAART